VKPYPAYVSGWERKPAKPTGGGSSPIGRHRNRRVSNSSAHSGIAVTNQVTAIDGAASPTAAAAAAWTAGCSSSPVNAAGDIETSLDDALGIDDDGESQGGAGSGGASSGHGPPRLPAVQSVPAGAGVTTNPTGEAHVTLLKPVRRP
jgi:hypothetical protein